MKITKIIFGLGTSEKISLNIYDNTGQLVKTLIDDEVFGAQYHHIQWAGKNDLNKPVSSRTYYLRLTANGNQKVIKMLLVR